MNEKQLRTFIQGYLHDRPQLSTTDSAVYQIIKDTLNEIYEEDFETYSEFYNLPLSLQVKILESFLDYEYGINDSQEDVEQSGYDNVETINESAILALGLIPLLLYIIVKLYKGSAITKAVYKTIYSIGKTLESAGNFLRRSGRKWRLKYEIINKGFRDCVEKAGIKDINKVGLAVYELLRKKPGTKIFATPEQVKQAERLRECYTDSFIRTISVTADMYFGCLRKANKLEEFKRTTERDIIVTLHAVPKMFRGSCNEIYEKLLEQLEKFDEYIDYVYTDEVDREEVRDRLRRAIMRRLQ